MHTQPFSGVSPAEVIISVAVGIFAINILVGGLIVRAWLRERRQQGPAADSAVTRSDRGSAS